MQLIGWTCLDNWSYSVFMLDVDSCNYCVLVPRALMHQGCVRGESIALCVFVYLALQCVQENQHGGTYTVGGSSSSSAAPPPVLPTVLPSFINISGDGIPPPVIPAHQHHHQPPPAQMQPPAAAGQGPVLPVQPPPPAPPPQPQLQTQGDDNGPDLEMGPPASPSNATQVLPPASPKAASEPTIEPNSSRGSSESNSGA